MNYNDTNRMRKVDSDSKSARLFVNQQSFKDCMNIASIMFKKSDQFILINVQICNGDDDPEEMINHKITIAGKQMLQDCHIVDGMMYIIIRYDDFGQLFDNMDYFSWQCPHSLYVPCTPAMKGPGYVYKPIAGVQKPEPMDVSNAIKVLSVDWNTIKKRL